MAFQFTVCPLDTCKRAVRFSDKVTDKATIDALMLSHGGCSKCTHKKRDREKRRLDRCIITDARDLVSDFEKLGDSKNKFFDPEILALYDLHRNIDYKLTVAAGNIRARMKFDPVRLPDRKPAKPRTPKPAKATAAEATTGRVDTTQPNLAH